MILKWSVFLVLTFFHSHTFHLNQPSGTAYRSMNKYFRSMWETFVIHCFNNCIVGYVTQIYNHLSQIFKRAVRFFQQGFHILPHSFCLFADVAGIYHIAFVVCGEQLPPLHLLLSSDALYGDGSPYCCFMAPSSLSWWGP